MVPVSDSFRSVRVVPGELVVMLLEKLVDRLDAYFTWFSALFRGRSQNWNGRLSSLEFY